MGSCSWRFAFALFLGASIVPGADSALLFNKSFGGSGNDYVFAITTDPAGYVIVGGSTSSYDFPVTNGSRNTATQFAGTSDSGASWHPLGNLPQGTPSSLAVAPGTPPEWYAAGNGGIFKSTDGGATWNPSLPGNAALCGFYPPNCGAKSLTVDPATPSTVYAVVDGAIMKTTDAGLTWSASITLPGGPKSAAYLLLDPLHPDHLFTGDGVAKFHSFDGGRTWTQYSTPAANPGNFCSNGLPPLAFDPLVPNLAYLAEHCEVFRSTDGGVSWSSLGAPFATAFSVATGPTVVYVSANGGLYGSTDQGVTWTLLLPDTGNAPPVSWRSTLRTPR